MIGSANAVDVSVGAHMQLNFGHIANRVVDSLNTNLSFSPSDNWQPLFDVAANARTFEQWYTLLYCINVSAVPFVGMIPTCIYLCVDGLFFPEHQPSRMVVCGGH